MLLPVSFLVPPDAKVGDTLKLRGKVLGPPEDMPPPPPQSRLGGPEEEVWELRDQFTIRRLPWWVVFIAAMYAMLKLFGTQNAKERKKTSLRFACDFEVFSPDRLLVSLAYFGPNALIHLFV
jgi:hypothetical protein